MQISSLYPLQPGSATYSPNRIQPQTTQAKADAMAGVRYEPSSSRISTDFGGYDKSGRLTAKASSSISTMAAPSFSSHSSEDYIVNRYAKEMGLSDNDFSTKLRESDLSVEELVVPNRARDLSDNPDTQSKLANLAQSERDDLLTVSGMTDNELTQFINTVKA